MFLEDEPLSVEIMFEKGSSYENTCKGHGFDYGFVDGLPGIDIKEV